MSLLKLPDELLLRIFRYVRRGEYPSTRYSDDLDLVDDPSLESSSDQVCSRQHTDSSELRTLHSLCLVCLRLSGPATEVLYENVNFDDVVLRSFAKTIKSSPKHACLVQSVDSFTVGIPGSHEDQHSILHAVKTGIDFLGNLLEKWNLGRFPKLIRPELNYLDNNLAFSACPNLRALGMSIHATESSVASFSARPVKQLEILGGDAVDIIVADIPVELFTANLTCLELRVPTLADAIYRSIAGIAPILGIPSLRHLSLAGFASCLKFGPGQAEMQPGTDLKQALQASKMATSSKLQCLKISFCPLSKEDTTALADQFPKLEALDWHNTGPCGIMGSTQRSQLLAGTADVVSIFARCAETIKKLVIYDPFNEDNEFSDWALQHIHNRGLGRNNLIAFNQEHCTASDFSAYSCLEELSVQLVSLSGPMFYRWSRFFPLYHRLPKSLQKLGIQFPMGEYMKQVMGWYTDQAEVDLQKLPGILCSEVYRNCSQLTELDIYIGGDWPFMHNEDRWQLRSVLHSAGPVHTTVYYPGHIDADEERITLLDTRNLEVDCSVNSDLFVVR